MRNTNISVSSSFNYSLSIEEQIKLATEVGFKFFSFGGNFEHFNYLKASERSKILPILKSTGLKIDTIHGKSLHQDKNLDILKSTIEAAKDFHASTIVLHICPFMFKKEDYSAYSSLLYDLIVPFEKLISENNISIALENVFPYHEVDLLLDFASKIESSNIGFCYDSSHDQIDGPRNSDLLDKMSKRLKAVHLSDRIKPFVDHVIPGEGFIDFETIIRKLAKSEFQGPYLFEVMMTHSKYQKPKEFLEHLKTEGDRLIGKLAHIT